MGADFNDALKNIERFTQNLYQRDREIYLPLLQVLHCR